MAYTKYNARDCVFQIESLNAPGTFVNISHLETFTKGHSSETTATTDFDSQGMAEGQAMERAKTLQLEGKRRKDPDTGAIDPGQSIVETLADRVGEASLGRIRFAAPGDTTYEVWTCYAELGDQGGGNNDKVSWAVTFTRSGASTTEPRP